MKPLIPPRQAARAAYLAAIINLLAAAAMWLWLRPGLPVPHSLLADRMGYVASHPWWWITGWGVWHLAALSLLAMLIGLAGQWVTRSPILCVLAVISASAGLCADLAAEMLYMGLAPDLGAQGFAILERVVGLLTGYLGNGLYTLAGMLLTFAGWRFLPIGLQTLSLVVWGAGLVLSGASLADSTDGQFWATAILMPSFVLWSAGVGRWLERQAS